MNHGSMNHNSVTHGGLMPGLSIEIPEDEEEHQHHEVTYETQDMTKTAAMGNINSMSNIQQTNNTIMSPVAA